MVVMGVNACAQPLTGARPEGVMANYMYVWEAPVADNPLVFDWAWPWYLAFPSMWRWWPTSSCSTPRSGNGARPLHGKVQALRWYPVNATQASMRRSLADRTEEPQQKQDIGDVHGSRLH